MPLDAMKMFKHPAFASKYLSNRLIRKSTDLLLEELYPKLKLDVGSDLSVRFTYEPLGNKRLSMEEATDAIFNTSPTLKSTRYYTGDGRTSYIGADTNPWANKLASMGYDVKVQTHELNDRTYQRFLDENASYGVIRPAGDHLAQLDVIDKAGRHLTRDEILKKLDIEADNVEQIFKRIGILTSDRAIYSLGDTPLNVFQFQTKRLALAEDPTLAASVSSFVSKDEKSAAKSSLTKYQVGEGKLDEETIYKRMFDSENLITRSGANRLFDTMRQEADRLEREALKLKGIDSLEYRRQMGIVEKLRETIRVEQASLRETGRFNARLLGEGLFKGDVGLVSKVHKKIIQKEYNLSDKAFEAIDFFSSEEDIKKELRLAKGHYISFETHGRPRQANTNILSSISHRNLFDPDFHLFEGTQREIYQHIDDIKAGKITPGLMRMIDDLADSEVSSDLSPEEKALAFKSKEFLQRLKISDDISENSYLTSQLFRAMKEHYLTKDKKGLLELRFPIRGSVGAHITTAPQTENPIMRGVMRFNGGVAEIHKLATTTGYEPGGGFDLDDRFSQIFQYDPETKRPLALAIRAPDEVGEFMYYSADVSIPKQDAILNRLIPLEIRQKDARFRELNIKLEHSQNTSLRQRNSWLSERDGLADQLNTFFSQNEDIAKVRLAERFAPTEGVGEFSVPKGHIRNARDVGRYERGSAFRGYQTSQELVGSNNTLERFTRFARAERRAEVHGNAGIMPYRVAPGADEWYGRFFKPIKALEGDANFANLDDRTVARIMQEAQSSNLLGRVSNITASIDDILKNAFANLPDELANQIADVVERSDLAHASKELTVDTVKKTGNANILKIIEDEIVNKNPLRTGGVFAEARQLVENYNKIHNTNISIGIDPATAIRLMPKDFREKFMAGFTGFDETTNIKEFSELFGKDGYIYGLDDMKNHLPILFDTEEKKIVDNISEETLHKLSRLDFSAEELSKASDFISHMGSVRTDYAKIKAAVVGDMDLDTFEGLFDGGDFDGDLNTAALRKLHDLRLFNSEMVEGKTVLKPTKELYRHLLATNKLLQENGASLSMLMTVGSSDENSMAYLLRTAKQRFIYGPEALQQLKASDSSLSSLGKFIEKDSDGNLSFTSLARNMEDPAERGQILIDKILKASKIKGLRGGRKEYLEQAKFIFEDLKQGGQFNKEELREFKRNVFGVIQNKPGARTIFSAPQATPIQEMRGLTLPNGTSRFTLRSLADDAADEVSAMGRESMTRLDMDVVRKMWNEPIMRKGMVGLGLFAGLGVIHRLTHNPTPEEVGGPPMLPAGSPYENYDNINYSAVSSMYPSSANFSSAGMLYSVNTSSGYDPQRLSTNLSAITAGPSSTRISKTRRTVGKKAFSSRDILSEMTG